MFFSQMNKRDPFRKCRLDSVSGLEQATDFLVRQHACQESLRLLGADCVVWHVGRKAESLHEQSEMANQVDAGTLGLAGLVRLLGQPR